MTAVLFAAIAPLVVWPIEAVFPYPHLVEELAKAVLVFFVLSTLGQAVTAGVVFAFSESVLYLFNIFAIGSIETLFTRLALTIPLHVGTTVLMFLFGSKRKAYLIPALALAITIHYLFNSWVAVWPRT